MPLRLYDTMRRAKVDFVPADPTRVTMYVCGPTVYGRAHIGNARPAVVFDVLARLLRHEYGAGSLVYARNITDIDDKIIAAAAAEGVAPDVVTRRFTDHYHADMAALGVARPDLEPRATEHVEPRVDDGRVTGMIPMIAGLIAGGKAYEAAGHVLFDVSADAGYGALSRRPMDAMIAGARVEVAPYKRNPADFVLWKPSTPDQPGWDSPWGRGRPGWHIECSAMIAAHLGETIDIHGGGLDLIFPHHENELAQSTCAHGAPLARVWMHNGFLSMGDTKMSKSLGNVVGVDELLAAGWSGEVIRLALLSAHYRQPLAWTEDLLAQTTETIAAFNFAAPLDQLVDDPSSVDQEFLGSLKDDLNTPKAIGRLHTLAKEATSRSSVKNVLWQMTNDWEQFAKDMSEPSEPKKIFISSARLLGLEPAHGRSVLMTGMARTMLMDRYERELVDEKIAQRTAARARRDFAESDRIRDELAAQGIVLEDGPGGTTWRRA